MSKVTIDLIGDVDKAMYSYCLDQMREAHESQSDVRIVLNSEGGSASDALAIAALIRKYPKTVEVHATGAVESAAVIILAAGTKGYRTMDSTAWVMVHEDDVNFTGTVSHVRNDADHYKHLETLWAKALEDYTGTFFMTWLGAHERRTYLYPENCLKYGLVDKIVEI